MIEIEIREKIIPAYNIKDGMNLLYFKEKIKKNYEGAGQIPNRRSYLSLSTNKRIFHNGRGVVMKNKWSLMHVFGFLLLMFFLAACEITINSDGDLKIDPMTEETNEEGTGASESGNEEIGESTFGEEEVEGGAGVVEDESTGEVNGQNALEQTNGISVYSYFPLHVGYEHHLGGDVPDGFEEYLKVLGERDDYFLAIGGSSAMGFYRLYQVNSQEAVIIFEVNEEHSEYYDLENLLSAGEINEAITYALDNVNANLILLQAPLVEEARWGSGIIINMNVPALLTNDETVPALLVEYPEIDEWRYFQEGVGLVGIFYQTEAVMDLFGGGIYAKKIVE